MAGAKLGAGAPARSSRGPRSRAGEAGAAAPSLPALPGAGGCRGCGAAPARQRAAVGARPCGDEPCAVLLPLPLPLPAPGAAAINGRGPASLESRGLFILFIYFLIFFQAGAALRLVPRELPSLCPRPALAEHLKRAITLFYITFVGFVCTYGGIIGFTCWSPCPASPALLFLTFLRSTVCI